MYAVVVLSLLGVVAADDIYSTKYDNVDIDAIINNERLFNNYYNCIMDRGKCSVEAAQFKKNISEAIETDCSKCSDKQKEVVRKLFKHLIENKNDLLLELEAKYDPQSTYRSKHKDDFKTGTLGI